MATPYSNPDPLWLDIPSYRDKPLLIWDGSCGFCRYWVTRWKGLTNGRVAFVPYQNRPELLQKIPGDFFRKAVRLLETPGTIYSGAEAVYRILRQHPGWAFLQRWYVRLPFFRKLSDWSYMRIAAHRPFFFRLSKLLFGKDPIRMKPYWLLYILFLIFTFWILGTGWD